MHGPHPARRLREAFLGQYRCGGHRQAGASSGGVLQAFLHGYSKHEEHVRYAETFLPYSETRLGRKHHDTVMYSPTLGNRCNIGGLKFHIGQKYLT